MLDGKYTRFRKPLYVALTAAGLFALIFAVLSAPLLLVKGTDVESAVMYALTGNTKPFTASSRKVATSSISYTRPLLKKIAAGIPPGSRTSSPATQAVIGYYDIGIPQSVSLATASSTVSKLGIHVAFEFSYLHVLVARLTAAQQTALAKNPSVAYVQPEIADQPLQVTVANNLGSTAYSPLVQQGSPTVAIVDDFSSPTSHGYEVLATYQAACATAGCADPDPTLISDSDPVTGVMSDDSVANGAIYAIDNGAVIVNISSGPVLASDSAGNASYGGTTSDVQLNLDETAQLNNATLVYAAGNDPNYVQPAFNGNNPYTTNIVPVGAVEDGQPASYSSVASETYAPGVAPNGADGTSFAAPTYAATLDANMHNDGLAHPTQDTIAETDNTPGFLPGNQVIVERNPDGTVQSVTSTQAAADSESDDDNGNTQSVDTNTTNPENCTTNDCGSGGAPTISSSDDDQSDGITVGPSSADTSSGDTISGSSAGITIGPSNAQTAPGDISGETSPGITIGPSSADTGSDDSDSGITVGPSTSQTAPGDTGITVQTDSNGDYSVPATITGDTGTIGAGITVNTGSITSGLQCISISGNCGGK